MLRLSLTCTNILTEIFEDLALIDRYSNYRFECGTDEAGRGCLAGPVTAAAVILPDPFPNDLLNDSKLLSAKKREQLRADIEREAVAYHVAHIFPKHIDEINILNASIMAMHKAVEGLKHKVEFIAVDGNRFKPFLDIPYKTIIKGDQKVKSIAAASILAKTYRDDYMQALHQRFPVYNWLKNKGYPTAEHRKAIEKNGITEHHRRSFRLSPQQYVFDF